MHTVHQTPGETPQPHRPDYPPPVDVAAIEAAVTAWIAARHPLP